MRAALVVVLALAASASGTPLLRAVRARMASTTVPPLKWSAPGHEIIASVATSVRLGALVPRAHILGFFFAVGRRALKSPAQPSFVSLTPRNACAPPLVAVTVSAVFFSC